MILAVRAAPRQERPTGQTRAVAGWTRETLRTRSKAVGVPHEDSRMLSLWRDFSHESRHTKLGKPKSPSLAVPANGCCCLGRIEREGWDIAEAILKSLVRRSEREA